MIVRRGAPGDAPAIAAIWNGVIANTTATFTTEPKDPEALAALADTVWIAEDGATVLGFALMAPFRAGPGYASVREHSVYVADTAHGRGVGPALMRALEAEAVETGIDHLIAGISGENAAAIAFHAALGFQHVGRLPSVGQKFGRRIDLVLMQKNLSKER